MPVLSLYEPVLLCFLLLCSYRMLLCLLLSCCRFLVYGPDVLGFTKVVWRVSVGYTGGEVLLRETRVCCVGIRYLLVQDILYKLSYLLFVCVLFL